MALELGLDVGHTFVRLAVHRPSGEVEPVAAPDGAKQTPCLAAYVDRRWHFGAEALRLSTEHPDSVARDVLDRLRRDSSVAVGGAAEPAAAVVTPLLGGVLGAAAGHPVTVAYPADWEVSAAARLAACVEVLGCPATVVPADLLAVLATEPAPDAAERVLVLDLGGETFQASLIQIEAGELRQVAVAARQHLAGAAFTSHLVEFLASGAAEELGYDLRHERALMTTVRARAEAAKIQLGRAAMAEVDLGYIVAPDGERLHLELTVSADDFHDMIQSSIAEALEAAREVVRGAQPTHLLLVGGSCQVPFVRRQFEAAFGQAQPLAGRPTQQVALGAARHAGGTPLRLVWGTEAAPPPVPAPAPAPSTQPAASPAPAAPLPPPTAAPPRNSVATALPEVGPGQTLQLTLRVSPEGVATFDVTLSGERTAAAPPMVAPAAPSPPAVVSRGLAERWVGRELIESGSTGTTYWAKDAITSRVVRIRAFDRDNDQARSAFLNNLQLLGLSHSNVAQILDFGADEQQLLAVLEWDDWPTLRDATGSGDGRSAQPVEWAVQVMRLAAAGVAAMHERRLCHRNLKPTNILVEPTMLDVRVTGADQATVVRTGEVLTDTVGTLSYMAPEVLARRADLRADVYALGVVLFELLTGHLPFAGANQRELLEAIRSHPTPTASHFNPNLPPSMDALLGRLLARDPQQRPVDATALLAELEALTIEPEPAGSGKLMDADRPADGWRKPVDEWEVER